MAKQSPTSKALQELRTMGFICEKVEQRLMIPNRWVTRDLFQMFDLVGVKAGSPILGVQVTSRSNLNARMAKIAKNPTAKVWLAAGGAIEAYGYGGVKTKKRVVRLRPDGTWQEVQSDAG